MLNLNGYCIPLSKSSIRIAWICVAEIAVVCSRTVFLWWGRNTTVPGVQIKESAKESLFRMMFESIGVKIKKLPPFSPQMNSLMENFIRAIKTECLDKMIFRSPEELHYAITQYLECRNHYRPHVGFGGKMVLPYDQDPNGEIREISFLGGLLHGYRKVPVAA